MIFLKLIMVEIIICTEYEYVQFLLPRSDNSESYHPQKTLFLDHSLSPCLAITTILLPVISETTIIKLIHC